MNWNKFLYSLVAAALIAVIIAIGIFAYAVWEAAKIEKETSSSVNTTIGEIGTTVQNVNDSAAQLEATLSTERQAVAQQLADADRLLNRLNDTADSLNKTIGSAGVAIDSVNTAAGSLNTAIVSQNAQLVSIEQSLDASAKQLTPAIANFGLASQAVAERMPVILGNVQEMTRQGVIIGQNVADTTNNIALTTHDVAQFTHRELSPVRGTWNLMEGVLVHFAGPAGQVATALRKK